MFQSVSFEFLLIIKRYENVFLLPKGIRRMGKLAARFCGRASDDSQDKYQSKVTSNQYSGPLL